VEAGAASARITPKGPVRIAGYGARVDRIGSIAGSLLKHYSAPVAVWQFGKGLTLVARPGEVVVDYLHAIEKAIGPLHLWVVAYTNDYYGYLASPRLLEEGGYETRGLSSGDGWFSSETSDALIRHVQMLAAQVGRQGGRR
jgi:hypothetical protein